MNRSEVELERVLDELKVELEERFPARSEPEQDQLFVQITTDRGDLAPKEAGRGRSRPKVVVAAVIAASLAVAITLLVSGSEDGPFAPPSASAALRKLSLLQSAHRSTDPHLKPGQFFYRQGESNTNYGEMWLSRKGTGGYSSLNNNGNLKRIHRKDAYGIYIGQLDLSYAEMLDLPRNPTRLFRVVKRAVLNGAQLDRYDGSLKDNQKIFRAIESFLVESPAPADVKASFYDVLAGMDFVHLIGTAETQDGRKGVAVGMWFNGGPDTDEVVTAADGTVLNERDDLIFDRKTGELIGDQIVLNGEITGEAIQTGIVDRLGQRPKGVGPPGALTGL